MISSSPIAKATDGAHLSQIAITKGFDPNVNLSHLTNYKHFTMNRFGGLTKTVSNRVLGRSDHVQQLRDEESDSEIFLDSKPKSSCPQYFSRDEEDDSEGNENETNRPGLERTESVRLSDEMKKNRFGGLQKALSKRAFFGRPMKGDTDVDPKNSKSEETAAQVEDHDNDDHSIELKEKPPHHERRLSDHEEKRPGLKRAESIRIRNRSTKCRRRDLLKSASTRSACRMPPEDKISAGRDIKPSKPRRRRSFDDLIKYAPDDDDENSDSEGSIDILLPSQVAASVVKRTDSIRRTRRAPEIERDGTRRGLSSEVTEDGIQRADSRRKLVRRTNSRRQHLVKRDEMNDSRRSGTSRSFSNGSLLSIESEELDSTIEEPNPLLIAEGGGKRRTVKKTSSRRSAALRRSNHSDSRSYNESRRPACVEDANNDSFSSILSGHSDTLIEEFASEDAETSNEEEKKSSPTMTTSSAAPSLPHSTKEKESRRSTKKRRNHNHGRHRRAKGTSKDSSARRKSSQASQVSPDDLHKLQQKLQEDLSQLQDSFSSLFSSASEAPTQALTDQDSPLDPSPSSLEDTLLSLPNEECPRSRALKPPSLNPPSLDPVESEEEEEKELWPAELLDLEKKAGDTCVQFNPNAASEEFPIAFITLSDK